MLLPTINRNHKLVLLAAILFAVGSTIFLLTVKSVSPKNALHYTCFEVENGWGYDIVVNKQIIIHQPFAPNLAGYQGWPSKAAAAAEAETVIEKIKSGEFRSPNHQPTQRSGVLPAQP